MLHVLITPIIFQTKHYFLDKCEPQPTKFRKGTLYNTENNNVPTVILDACFDI